VLLLVVGIALNGSLAGFALALPVVAASLIILVQPGRWMRRSLGLVAIAALIGAVGLMAASSIGSTKVGADARTSVDSRAVILQTTGKAIADSFPWGSGLGSFLQVYRTYESPDTVTNEYVVHAHNDYAELALELGLPGIVLILLFLGWWAAATWSVWWNGEGGPYARAASIASAALLVHSLVEFPLRTAALATCFAMCLALLADRRRPQEQAVADLRPTRHVVIG
jgi:O-antigen ligase